MPTPEQSARTHIDAQLSVADWNVQDLSELNLAAGRGIAVPEELMNGQVTVGELESGETTP